MFSSKGQSNEAPATEGQHYCVDENTERRNHYLDLAGIENYTSRFEGKGLFILFEQPACCCRLRSASLYYNGRLTVDYVDAEGKQQFKVL